MPTNRSHPTMADVAEKAGVSVSTVSRTLRGLETVSPQARLLVEQAARELNFVVSRQASSLVTGKTRAVAVLTPNLDTWFTGSVLTGISGVLSRADLDMKIYAISDLAERAEFFDRLPTRRNADALLVASFDLTEQECAELDGLHMPVVYISQHAPGRTSVYVDDVAGGHTATRHLLNLGHRRIAFLRLADVQGFTYSSRHRLTGYRQALTEAGIPLDDTLVAATTGGLAGIRKAVGSLLSLRHPPTAIFAEHDHIAMEAMRVLRDSGLGVPEHISVIGFDDHDVAEWIDLSTIAQPAADLGRTAGELATALINDPETNQGQHIVLPTYLVPRGSTAPVPASGAVPAGLERSGG